MFNHESLPTVFQHAWEIDDEDILTGNLDELCTIGIQIGGANLISVPGADDLPCLDTDDDDVVEAMRADMGALAITLKYLPKILREALTVANAAGSGMRLDNGGSIAATALACIFREMEEDFKKHDVPTSARG